MRQKPREVVCPHSNASHMNVQSEISVSFFFWSVDDEIDERERTRTHIA